ncbi:MAG TPA: DUF3866 family protein [Bacillota bacterium]
MFAILAGEVVEIIADLPDLQKLKVQVDGEAQPQPAYNYPLLNRRLKKGERVRLNVSAVKLGLGTGGYHFVIPDYHGAEPGEPLGHIMKLRYTPWQFPVLAAEETNSPLHDSLITADSLEGIPVVAAPLHSMLPGVILGFRQVLNFQPKIAYVMTDAAALPLALSDLVRQLQQRGWLDLTVTAGQAFGGDLEAVSIPAALLAARQAIQADLIIVALGPGIVGTGTKYGFSGVEQAWILDLTARLGGIPIAVPRISSADQRQRHRGLSHHSRTILTLAYTTALVPFSRLFSEPLQGEILAMILGDPALARHHWYFTTEPPAGPLFCSEGLKVKTMGRTVAEDPAYFQATVAAGYLAAQVRLGKLSSLEPLKKS